MNKYIGKYQNKKDLENLKFKELYKKARLYALSALVLGCVGYLIAPLSELNIFSYSNLFLGFVIGLLVFWICASSCLKLWKLYAGQRMLLDQWTEIDSKIQNDIEIGTDALIAITKDNHLAIVWLDKQGEFKAYLANNKYIHHSPVKFNDKEKETFEKVANGDLGFYKVKESL